MIPALVAALSVPGVWLTLALLRPPRRAVDLEPVNDELAQFGGQFGRFR